MGAGTGGKGRGGRATVLFATGVKAFAPPLPPVAGLQKAQKGDGGSTRGSRYIRLCFARLPAERLREAAAVLGAAVRRAETEAKKG